MRQSESGIHICQEDYLVPKKQFVAVMMAMATLKCLAHNCREWMMMVRSGSCPCFKVIAEWQSHPWRFAPENACFCVKKQEILYGKMITKLYVVWIQAYSTLFCSRSPYGERGLK